MLEGTKVQIVDVRFRGHLTFTLEFLKGYLFNTTSTHGHYKGGRDINFSF